MSTPSLTLHFHPLAQYCQKALTALYESETPFTPHHVDLSKPDERAALMKLSPFAKFPVLEDRDRGEVVTEATIVVEYVAQHHAGKSALVPADRDHARVVRHRDRILDLYVADSVAKIVTDQFRPNGEHDPYGVARAKETLETAYGVMDAWFTASPWATGDTFTMTDCAATGALFYASRLLPLGSHTRLAGYLARLLERPSVARVRREAEPYMHMFPG